MTEHQVQAATAVYAQLTTVRQELAQLIGVRPYLSGLSLHAPGMKPLRLEGVQAERLTATAQLAEALLSARITALEHQLAAL